MTSIPSEYQPLFKQKTFAHVATLMPDGMPHITPVWIDYDADADRVLVNTAKGRQKHTNVENDPRIGVSLTDPENSYRALSLYGEVENMTEENAVEHIDSLEQRYRGNDTYEEGDRTKRIILEIRPEKVFTR